MSGYNQFSNEEDEEGNLGRNEGEKFRQYQAAILAALAGTAAGTGDGWILTSLLKNEFLNDENDYVKKKLFANIMNVAALIGALLCGYLAEKIGRKTTLIIAGLMTMPTWILYMISHKILISLKIGAGLGGLASGLVSVAVPLYIAEISESSIRGTLGVFFYLHFVAGELFTTIEGSDLNHVATNCILVASIFLISFIWMPESPFSLLAKGEENEAKKSIKFLRGANYNSEEELETLKQAVSKKTTLKGALKEEKTVSAFIVSLTLMLLSRMTAFDGFNVRLYKLLLHDHTNIHDNLTTIFLLIHIIGIAGAAFFIDRLGRRLLLIVSASIMAFNILIFVIIDMIIVLNEPLALLFFAIYLAAFSIGVGPVPWVIMTELIPHQHKALSSTLSAGLFWFMVSTSSLRFRLVFELPFVGIVLIYLILCIFIILLTVFMIPETKGRNVNCVEVPSIKTIIFRNRNSNNVNVV